MEDLWELAWGIIAAEEAFSASPQILPLWKKQVRGLCEAFQSIGTVIVRNNWFHSRDFIFLCRLLRIKVLFQETHDKRAVALQLPRIKALLKSPVIAAETKAAVSRRIGV